MEGRFLYRKLVDKSTLRQGFSIPVAYQPVFLELSGGLLTHGESMKVKILIDGQMYDAEWKNQGFDQNKYTGHTDVMQFRYSENSLIAQRLRLIFSSSQNYIQEALSDPDRPARQLVRIPDELQEFILISATSQPDIFAFDCITCADQVSAHQELKKMSEEMFEESTFLPKYDATASVVISESLHKVRKLDRSIGDSLKKLYDYHCQVTGERIGNEYAAEVVEAHHIEPFTRSMNNDTNNIIILSPNFHRIIHKANPIFDRNKLAFIFPNGVEEKVKLNKHLYYTPLSI